jgi:hypothetical protein
VLWLQLLSLTALPAEAVLLVLLLAGADPGPFPGFERLLTWALGALAPAVLFWRFPPDLWSLLLVQVPLRGRRPEQLRLSALQNALPVKLLAAAGAAGLLPLSWWADASAGMAWAWSPLSASPRLVVLLACVPLLALMLWQWQQAIQALWMFSRGADQIEQTLPLTQVEAAEQRLNLGLPLLLLAPLQPDVPAEASHETATAAPAEPIADQQTGAPTPEEPSEGPPEEAPDEPPAKAANLPASAAPDAEIAEPEPAEPDDDRRDAPQPVVVEPDGVEPEAVELEIVEAEIVEAEIVETEAEQSPSASVDVAVAPEQDTEEAEGSELDQQV